MICLYWIDRHIIIACVYFQAMDELVIRSVTSAVHNGYQHIDTAPLYKVEPSIGKALQAEFKKGTAKREDLFITSKVYVLSLYVCSILHVLRHISFNINGL